MSSQQTVFLPVFKQKNFLISFVDFNKSLFDKTFYHNLNIIQSRLLGNIGAIFAWKQTCV